MKSGVSDPRLQKKKEKTLWRARRGVLFFRLSFQLSAFSFQLLAFRPQVFFSEAVAEREQEKLELFRRAIEGGGSGGGVHDV